MNKTIALQCLFLGHDINLCNIQQSTYMWGICLRCGRNFLATDADPQGYPKWRPVHDMGRW